MLEKDIEAAVCKYARNKGCIAYKFSSPERVNVPDRIIVFPWKHIIFIEFKAPGKKPSPGQTREHQRLLERGQQVFTIDNVEAGKMLIDDVLQTVTKFKEVANDSM